MDKSIMIDKITEKKNIRDSVNTRDDESRDEYLERLEGTYLGLSSSSTQHKRMVDGAVASSLIGHNNRDNNFMNQYRKFYNNEDMSEKSITDKDFYNNVIFSQGIYDKLYHIISMLFNNLIFPSSI